jgi:hypothetical protein
MLHQEKKNFFVETIKEKTIVTRECFVLKKLEWRIEMCAAL